MRNDTLEPADAEIVRQVIEGNVNAFEILLKRHQELVMRIVKKHLPAAEVEETVQDVFVKSYRSLASFRGSGDFSHWLSVIAVKTCYDYWRRAYRTREMPLSQLTDRHREWLEKVMSAGPEASGAGRSQSEARELLDWALAKLSAADRMVIELVYLEGLTVKEAAERLGWSISNVKIRSFRSRRKLKKILTVGLARQ